MKVNCTNPDHKDSTPSMEVYDNGGYCFVCNWVDKSVADSTAVKREPEDIEKTYTYINNLPKKLIRGLVLPYDDTGYYITWPDRSYYKKRTWSGVPRYIGPRGKQPPLLRTEPVSTQSPVCIVEGELNAISLNTVTGYTVFSPGSASEFKRHLPECYNIITNLLTPNRISITINLIVDKDPAGVAAGVYAKRELLKRGMRVSLIGCEKDCNEILQQQGPEGLRKWAEENLEMPFRM